MKNLVSGAQILSKKRKVRDSSTNCESQDFSEPSKRRCSEISLSISKKKHSACRPE